MGLGKLNSIFDIFDRYKNTLVALEFAAPIICQEFKVDRIVIFRKSHDLEKLEDFLGFFYEWSNGVLKNHYDTERRDRKVFFREGSIFQKYASTLAQGKPLSIEKKNLDLLTPGLRDFYQDADFEHSIVVPVFNKGSLWGTIALHSAKGGDFLKTKEFKDKTILLTKIFTSHLNITESLDSQSISTLDDHSRRMESLGKMAASIAHEINNPIFIIGGFATKLEQLVESNEILDEKVIASTCLTQIQEGCKKITNIIEGLRLMSRDAKQDELEVVDINTIVKRTADISKERLQMAKINLELVLHDSEVLVECRPSQLAQIFSNLINNSTDSIAKFTEEKWIKIITNECKDHVTISIVDSGGAVSDEVARNMFEPFFTTKEPGKGTGLGLSICREILNRFNGTIAIDQESPNVKFDIVLPKISFEEGED